MVEDHFQAAVRLRDRVLFMEFSHEPKPGGPGASQGGRDWVCEMCKGINFFR